MYVCGAVAGSLFFGYLADKLGRKKLFVLIPCVYLTSSLLTALSINYPMMLVCLLVTGFGIGGEYSAMNSAINELVPSGVRGIVDIAVNGSYWLGAALGGAITYMFITLVHSDESWRLVWLLGSAFAVLIIWLRSTLPESPRWLINKGREDEAEAIVTDIEAKVAADLAAKGRHFDPTEDVESLTILHIELGKSMSMGEVTKVLWGQYRSRALLCLVLMLSQAYLFNAIFPSLSLSLSLCLY
ncbi:major facilitator, sugar transporter-like, partial [Kipferlia bialata]|eukprot:g12811.t1